MGLLIREHCNQSVLVVELDMHLIAHLVSWPNSIVLPLLRCLLMHSFQIIIWLTLSIVILYTPCHQSYRFIDEPKKLSFVQARSASIGDLLYGMRVVWKRMCLIHGFDDCDLEKEMVSQRKNRRRWMRKEKINDIDNGIHQDVYIIRASSNTFFSLLPHLDLDTNWRKGGILLRSHPPWNCHFSLG